MLKIYLQKDKDTFILSIYLDGFKLSTSKITEKQYDSIHDKFAMFWDNGRFEI